LPPRRDQPGDLLQLEKKYDGLLPTEMKRLKRLEDENSKLRKLVADLSLDKEMLQDVIRRKL
jgi:putative transposase